jgi:small-conductance mechanosensitive channel
MERFIPSSVPPWVWGPIAFLVWMAALYVIKRLTFRAIHKQAEKTHSRIDDLLVTALSAPLNVLIWASGLYILVHALPLSEGWDRTLSITMMMSVVLAIVIFVDRLTKGLLDFYEPTADFIRSSRNLVQGTMRVVILALGIFIVLDSMGVSITPLIASLGVGSLAVALALQDTLSNFFAGIQVVIDKPLQVGHFVRLESGEEGFVEKVGLRSTWIRMLPNNVIVVPNAKLVSGQILNYHLPVPEMSVLVQVGVHYDSDLEHVERVTVEVARETLSEIEGGVAEFEPFIRYRDFSDSSIDFTVILRTRDVVERYLIKHEFMKRLHKRYNEEGIVIPFPIRTLDISREDLETLAGK